MIQAGARQGVFSEKEYPAGCEAFNAEPAGLLGHVDLLEHRHDLLLE